MPIHCGKDKISLPSKAQKNKKLMTWKGKKRWTGGRRNGATLSERNKGEHTSGEKRKGKNQRSPINRIDIKGLGKRGGVATDISRK